MTYKEQINAIESISYSKYKDISSNEKLVAYACMYLSKNSIPLYFNYICVAAFKLFPDKFCLDDEFKEYPSADRLNRTILHMHTNKSGNNYLIGDAVKGFSLTELGKLVGEQVKKEIETGTISEIKAPKVDDYKKGYHQEYEKFTSSEFYKNYKETQSIDLNLFWKFKRVIPFTQIKKIKSDLKNISIYAKNCDDQICINCIKLLEDEINV